MTHTSIAYNIRDQEPVSYQPGGNLLLSINKAAHRVKQIDKDPTGLGRWTSTVFRGKQNIVLRVILVYRAYKSRGPNSAYMQQQQYFDTINRDICPQEAVLDDLGAMIKTCHERQEQVVLMMDCNENTQS